MLLAAGTAFAQAPKKMTFKIEHGMTNRPIAEIVAEGPIVASTPIELEALLKANANDDIEYISLSSGGGSLGAALELGRVIRKYRLLASIPLEGKCLSACAYAFLGGVARNLETGYGDDAETDQRRLGFHGFTFDLNVPTSLQGQGASSFADRVARDTQVTAGGLADYVRAMGVNIEIVQRASTYGRNSFLFLPTPDLIKLGILTNYESDLGEFKLIPDSGGVTAIFIHEDHQFVIGCHVRSGAAARPVIAFTQHFYADPAAPRKEIATATKLSTLLAGTPRPWAGRDFEHKHFHAHDWMPNTGWNPVFGLLEFRGADKEAENEYFELGSSNFSFFTQGDLVTAVADLPLAKARQMLTEKEVYLGLLEREHGDGWRHVFQNDDRDREVLAYALRPCLR